jgi:hypothetical protein
VNAQRSARRWNPLRTERVGKDTKIQGSLCLQLQLFLKGGLSSQISTLFQNALPWSDHALEPSGAYFNQKQGPVSQSFGETKVYSALRAFYRIPVYAIARHWYAIVCNCTQTWTFPGE